MGFANDYIPQQADLAAATETTVYTCPNGRLVKITVVFTNRAAIDTVIRLSLAVAGASVVAKQYIIYGPTLKANSTTFINEFTVQSNDVVRAYSSNANCSVNVLIDDVRQISDN